MKRIALVAAMLLVFGFSANAQMIGATNNQAQPRTTAVRTPYSPGLAWFESFFIPGLGQILETKQYGKGIGMMAGSVVCVSILGNADDVEETLVPIAALGFIGIWIWSQIDAPVVANRLNRQSGFVLLDIGERGLLSMQPTMDYINIPLASTKTFTTGLKLSLKF